MQRFAVRSLIVALVAGSFGLGSSQYLVMALLPEIAADLSPGASTELSEVLSSFLASGYALGAVVGLLVVPALLRRLSDAATLLACSLAMLLLTLAVVVSPTLLVAVPLRFLSAMMHATYLGAASVVVSRLLGPGRDGLGAALVIGGLTLANLVAVPALTAVGAQVSWRIGLLACAALFVPAVVAALAAAARLNGPVPASADAPSGETESARAGARPSIVALSLALMAAGVFATLSFIAPLTRDLQGGEHTVPMFATMLVFGIGMNIGNFVGGWQADRSPMQAMWQWAALGAAGSVVLLFGAASGATSLLGALLIGGALGGITPPAQVMFLQLLPGRRRLAASLASGSVNLGNVTGTTIAGTVVVGFGVTALPVVSLTITALGIALALTAQRRERMPVSA